MTKAVSELVKKIEDGYGKKQFEVLSIVKNTDETYSVIVKEIPVEEDK